MKKIRLEIYHNKGQNVVEMQRVEKSATPAYLTPLEKMLKRFKPQHRHGSSYFFVEDKPGQSVFAIFSAFKSSEIFNAEMGSDRTPRVAQEAEESEEELDRLVEIKKAADEHRSALKVLNKEARSIKDRRIERSIAAMARR